MNLLYECSSEMCLVAIIKKIKKNLCLVANSEYVNCTDGNLDRDMSSYELILFYFYF